MQNEIDARQRQVMIYIDAKWNLVNFYYKTSQHGCKWNFYLEKFLLYTPSLIKINMDANEIWSTFLTFLNLIDQFNMKGKKNTNLTIKKEPAWNLKLT